MITLENNFSIKNTSPYKKYRQSIFRLLIVSFMSSLSLYLSYHLTPGVNIFIFIIILLFVSFLTAAVFVYAYKNFMIYNKNKKQIDKLIISNSHIILQIKSKTIYLDIIKSHSSHNIILEIKNKYIYIQYGSYYLCAKNDLNPIEIEILSNSVTTSNRIKLDIHYSSLLDSIIKYNISNSFSDRIIVSINSCQTIIFLFLLSIITYIISLIVFTVNSIITFFFLNTTIALIWSFIFIFIPVFSSNKIFFGKAKNYFIGFKDNKVLFFIDDYLIDVKDLSYLIEIVKLYKIYKINTVDKIILLSENDYKKIFPIL
ncbi:hypothetical protein [Thomasclavelia sp.]